MLMLNGLALTVQSTTFSLPKAPPLVVTPHFRPCSPQKVMRSTKPFLMYGSPPENSMW